MSKQLPDRPNLDHLRKQAKDLLLAYRNRDPNALQRFAALPTKPELASLHDAQAVVAREYGFESWTKLVRHVEGVRADEGITDEVVEHLARLAFSNSDRALLRLLELYPKIRRHDIATALICGETDMVRAWLVDHKPSERVGRNGWPPIVYASGSRFWHVEPNRYEAVEESVRWLLDAGADANEKFRSDGFELPLLYVATCVSQHPGIARLLLERDANPNDGESVYHSAQLNLREMLELLVAHGANVSKADESWGNTPLYFNGGHRPSDSGYERAMLGIEWLLDHGAAPNVPSGECQQTPLFAAIRAGNARLVAMLLERGADPNIADKDGLTPYMLAAAIGAGDVLDLLAKAGANTDLPVEAEFLAACARGDERRVEEILAGTPAIIQRLGQRGSNAFCKMAELGRTVGVKTCLDAGFGVDTRGPENATALHFASYCQWDETAVLLIERGAPLDVRDSTYNATPLGWVLEGFLYNRNAKGSGIRVVNELLKAGASDEDLKRRLETDEAENPAMKELVDALNR